MERKEQERLIDLEQKAEREKQERERQAERERLEALKLPSTAMWGAASGAGMW